MKIGKKQTIETLINEEALLLGKFLRDEWKFWSARIAHAQTRHHLYMNCELYRHGGIKMGKRFYQQTIPVETEIEETIYSCSECGEFLFSVPRDQPVPQQKTTITCSKKHKIRVPKFPQLEQTS